MERACYVPRASEVVMQGGGCMRSAKSAREWFVGKSWKGRSGLLLMLLTRVAWAAPPVYAVHPVNVLEATNDAQMERLQKAVHRSLKERGLTEVPVNCVQHFVAELPQHSCEADEGCLLKLGKACKASRVLWVSVSPNAARWYFSGLLVNAEAHQAQRSTLELARPAKAKREAKLEEVTLAFVQALEARPPEALAVPDIAEVKHPTPVATMTPTRLPQMTGAPANSDWAQPMRASVTQTTSGRTWKTPVGLALGAVGVVALGVGAVFGVQANAANKRYDSRYGDTGTPPVLTPDQRNLLRSDLDKAASQKTIGTVGLIGGVAAGLVGVGLFVWDSVGVHSSEPKIALSVGPAAAQVRITLP